MTLCTPLATACMSNQTFYYKLFEIWVPMPVLSRGRVCTASLMTQVYSKLWGTVIVVWACSRVLSRNNIYILVVKIRVSECFCQDRNQVFCPCMSNIIVNLGVFFCGSRNEGMYCFLQQFAFKWTWIVCNCNLGDDNEIFGIVFIFCCFLYISDSQSLYFLNKLSDDEDITSC